MVVGLWRDGQFLVLFMRLEKDLAKIRYDGNKHLKSARNSQLVAVVQFLNGWWGQFVADDSLAYILSFHIFPSFHFLLPYAHIAYFTSQVKEFRKTNTLCHFIGKSRNKLYQLLDVVVVGDATQIILRRRWCGEVLNIVLAYIVIFLFFYFLI